MDKDKFYGWVGAVLTVVIVTIIFATSSARTERIMSIDYCWDSEGQYYVAPDTNCTR